jgi:uncharacterized protein YeaO (DUF488 family)
MDLTHYVKLQETGIKVSCYYSILRKKGTQYPNAHFELISLWKPRWFKEIDYFGLQFHHSPELAPKKELLRKGQNKEISFSLYLKKLERQIFNNSKAVKRLFQLRELSKRRLVFLVCHEKDETKCHRNSVMKWLNNLDEIWKSYRRLSF